MAGTLETLGRKRSEIERTIANYEARLEEARADLAALDKVCAIFTVPPDPAEMLPYDTHRLFKRKELVALCKEALALGPMTSRSLAEHVMVAKGWAADDGVLFNSLCIRIGCEMGRQAKRGGIFDHGKRHNAHVWGLPESVNGTPL